MVLPIPEPEAESVELAAIAGTTALEAYLQRDLTPTDWMDNLYPHLSQTGAEAYIGTDPQQIPRARVTGAPVLLPAATDFSLIVRIPTDAGDYNITLTRPTKESPWLAERIRPAAD